MNLTRFIGAALKGTVVGALGSAAWAAAAGAAGAAILDARGYEGYATAEAMTMGALGGAILGGTIGGVSNALTSCGFFQRQYRGGLELVPGLLAGSMLSGLAGYGIMTAVSDLIMTFAQTAAAFSIGSAVLMVPAFCILMGIIYEGLQAPEAAPDQQGLHSISFR